MHAAVPPSINTIRDKSGAARTASGAMANFYHLQLPVVLRR
jgi:hypothetical protein